MKGKRFVGLAAAAAAAVLALLICGMGKKEAEPVLEPVIRAETPAPSQRTVKAIVVHQSREKTFGDGEKMVTVLVEGTAREMDLEDYLTGVLMGEMPASFHLEALKAQAVAARTYTLRRLQGGGTLSDDPAVCQAFIPLDKAPEKLGEDWETLLEKLKTAVRETEGQVLTYEGNLISATYFSSSGGKTESAQAVWGGDAPYLVSVNSPGEESDSDESTVTVPLAEFLSALEISDPGVSSVTYTQGGGVDTMVIGGKEFAGTELRKRFGLRSTCFSMAETADSVVFQVRGNGHRVGLSQYGAQAMAEAGRDYEEILKWYYTGVTLCDYEDIAGAG